MSKDQVNPYEGVDEILIGKWNALFRLWNDAKETRESLLSKGVEERLVQAYEECRLLRQFSESMFLVLHHGFQSRITREKLVNQTELEIEFKFCEFLLNQGVKVKRQVHCELGFADIITQDAIYEIKANLTLDTVRQAVSQLLGYQFCINPNANLYIVGRILDKDVKFLEFTKFHNVEIINYCSDGSFKNLSVEDNK